MKPSTAFKKSDKFESFAFWGLVVIGLLPLIFTKYYLTLDGPDHIYSGNIIKELLLGNHSEFTNLFKFNPLLVPNWLSHFLFASLNFLFPDYISEKIVIGSYLILFPFFFRKIILWFAPENKAFSYLGVLFAHNHLLYLGFYNMAFALVAFFATIYFILNYVNNINFRQITILGLLFLLVYFSHILILLVTIMVALFLPIASLKTEKIENGIIVPNWNLFYTKVKVILLATIPSLILTGIYIFNVDSLGQASRLDLEELLLRILDVRPLLTLCYCDDWKYLTHVLFALFVLMMGTNLFLLIRNNCNISEGQLKINLPKPTYSIIWFLLFITFTVLYLIVPDANVLPERLIILVFIFLCFWLATQTYPRWLHKTAILVIVVIQFTFSYWYTNAMIGSSNQIEQMKEVTQYIEPGSLLLPLNYAYNINWLHSHSSGYFGSGKPIVVLENYEGPLKWFPVNWNSEGPYDLEPIRVWGPDNKNMIVKYFTNPQNPNIFSLPRKDGKIQEIPYAVIFGKMPDDTDPDYQQIKSILDKSYSLTFQNEFCKLYQLGLKK